MKLQTYIQVTTAKPRLTSEDDRVVAETMAWYEMAKYHVEAAQSPLALNVMMEAVQNVTKLLIARQQT